MFIWFWQRTLILKFRSFTVHKTFRRQQLNKMATRFISSWYRTIDCVLELINYRGTKSASMKRSELHCSISISLAFVSFSIFHFTFIVLMLLPVNKIFEIILFFFAELERIKMHTVLETNVVCSLKRLTERDKPFRSNKPFYWYGGHIEIIRFKEYYRMPRGHEHISFVFSNAFRDIFS